MYVASRDYYYYHSYLIFNLLAFRRLLSIFGWFARDYDLHWVLGTVLGTHAHTCLAIASLVYCLLGRLLAVPGHLLKQTFLNLNSNAKQ